MSLAGTLQTGLTALGVAVPAAAQQQLLAYLNLLHKWNAAYNLTAVRGRERMLTQQREAERLPGGPDAVR